MNLSLRMCLAIPQQELGAYTKTFKPYYVFMELASKSHMSKVMELEPVMLAQLVSSIEEGLLSFDMAISMQCCATVDNIVNFFYQHREKQTQEGELVRRFQAAQGQSFRRILKLMFHLLINGEHNSTWSISRPLLGLILIYPEEYQQIRDNLMQSQMEERQPKLQQFFVELMNGVDNNLTTKNKDFFTRNLYNFATSVRQII
jgi:exportin-7